MTDAASVMSASSNTKTKRIASPKMRHVRALSPYSKWQAQGELGLSDQKSFLSNKFGGTFQGEANDKNMANLKGQDADKSRADYFNKKLEMLRNMKSNA